MISKRRRTTLCLRLLVIAALAVTSNLNVARSEAPENSNYVFSYFKGNGEDGLHLAWSRDALNWQPLNNDKPIVHPTVGGKLMRDPSIVQGPDGVFHMVWSSGWWDLGFGHASSKDLIHWTEQQFVPVNQDVMGAKNTWAPDLYFDTDHQQFVIMFATTIPGRFPETDQGGDHNHRQYWVTTKDFKSFSKPTLAFDPGHNCIDGTIVKLNDSLTLLYKDERPDHKTLHAATTSAIGKPWSMPGKLILDRDWVEGPTVLRADNVWMLYFDCYREGHYGAAESKDGVNWNDVTTNLKMPPGARHGTAFVVRPEILDELLKLKGVQDGANR